ncbi:MAG: valine--tRNA ligase [Hyphomicrobiales bacterium]|nr:valine--tRNA ligase [Hyphomicrobiales bacterium]
MLEKTYQPAEIEARIHADWETAEAFRCLRPDRVKADPYCIVIPPPNVTGSLHMGHALNNTLQDILCRFERMNGKDVLWQPGTDHAGIATQLVVERQLAERQIRRRDLGRDKFLEEVWRWKAQSGGTIINQLKRLGASCDWSRERFTMDEGLSKAVLKVFVDLYEAGLIYKDKRLVNWDPEFQSAVSDLEVDMVETTGSYKWAEGDKDKDGNPKAFDATALGKVLAKNPSGHLYHFRYPIKGRAFSAADPSTYIVVATTRPETMLGDTGVAVHPDDERYKALVGQTVILPLVGREIPIVADTYSDPTKGSGAVKITPAHDFNDWEVGKRCKLAVVNIMDERAHLNDEVPPPYRGLDRFEARKRVVADLHALGLLAKIEVTTHAVPHSQRGAAVIEPFLTDQWYVDAATLAKPALDAVRSGETKFVPEKYAADYFRWLENIQPWCISRQLWWGHQIPAWYGPKASDDGVTLSINSDGTFDRSSHEIFVAASEKDALELARRKYPGRRLKVISSSIEQWESFFEGVGDAKAEIPIWRDPDVLDTWFSSGIWPMSTLGWPEETKELKKFYPTSTLVTGFDIIFFWVARMMMTGVHFMREVPFKDVYIHGLVLDERGQKMSKTKGNVIDPLELIEKFGADALRFALASQTAQGRNIRLSTQRVEGYRNFATKLWNAARFAEMNECVRQRDFKPKSVKQTLNQWITGETERAVAAVTEAIRDYRFNEAAGAAYDFTWRTFCDWYLELAKPILNGEDEPAKAETRATTAWVLDQILKMLHPFMPFITEELWGRMVEVGEARKSLLCLATWPTLKGLAKEKADDEIGWLVKLISEVRSVRSEMNVPAGAKVPLTLVGASKETKARVERHHETIERLARAEAIRFETAPPKGAAQIVVNEATVCLPLAGVIDMAGERKRLEKAIASANADMGKMNAKLENPSFMSRAAPEAIEEAQERKAELTLQLAKLAAAVKRIDAAV